MDVLFIIGLPRSGTSLVQKLVHEKTGRKSPTFRQFGVDVSRVPREVRALNRTFEGENSLAEDNDYPGYRFGGDFHEYREWLERRGDYWVLKSPDHIGQLAYIVHTFPEARFLWCVRGGSATMQSVYEYFSTTGLGWPYNPIKGLKESLYIAKAMPEKFDWIYTPTMPEWGGANTKIGYDSQVTQDIDYIQGQLKGVCRGVSSDRFEQYYSREGAGAGGA
jgi:hypothetical protein